MSQLVKSGHVSIAHPVCDWQLLSESELFLLVNRLLTTLNHGYDLQRRAHTGSQFINQNDGQMIGCDDDKPIESEKIQYLRRQIVWLGSGKLS